MAADQHREDKNMSASEQLRNWEFDPPSTEEEWEAHSIAVMIVEMVDWIEAVNETVGIDHNLAAEAFAAATNRDQKITKEEIIAEWVGR